MWMSIKNSKGFTLIELVITVSILAIITIIAVPNVINIQQKSEKKQYIEDAKRFLELVEYNERSNSTIASKLLTEGVSLSEINRKDTVTSPEGYEYEGRVVKKNGTYIVCLLEIDGKYEVIATMKELYEDNAVVHVVDRKTNRDCFTKITDSPFSKKITSIK